MWRRTSVGQHSVVITQALEPHSGFIKQSHSPWVSHFVLNPRLRSLTPFGVSIRLGGCRLVHPVPNLWVSPRTTNVVQDLSRGLNASRDTPGYQITNIDPGRVEEPWWQETTLSSPMFWNPIRGSFISLLILGCRTSCSTQGYDL